MTGERQESSVESVRSPDWAVNLLSWVREKPQFAALGGFVLAYFFGVVTWSWYLEGKGLGAIALDPVHYLTAGFFALAAYAAVIAMNIGLGWGLDRSGHDIDLASWRDVAGAVMLQMFITLISAIAGLWSVTLLGREMGILHMEPINVMITAVIMSLLVLFGEWLVLANLVFGARRRRRAVRDRKQDGGKTNPRHIWTTPGRVVATSLLWMLFVLIVFSNIFLPAMAPEFGGARARQAVMDVDASQLSEETKQAILPRDSWNVAANTTIVRSNHVTVLLVLPDSFIIERPKAAGIGPPITISKDVVRAVIWLE